MKLLLAALALLCAVSGARAAEMVVLSDIHFDPTADAVLVDRLAAAAPEQWDAILDTGTARLAAYGQDSDWKLLRSALGAMKAQTPPGLVLVPGDFLVHNFRARFDKSASDHSDAAFAAFGAKTMAFLAMALQKTFPGVPVFPVLGNNDSLCGDYGVEPGGAFLAATEPLAASLAQAAGDPGFAASWRALGDYVLPNPLAPGERIVVLNTNFFSPHYRQSCGSLGAAAANPAMAALDWLGHVLGDAESAHQKAILAYHIPPGIDAFATGQHPACPLTPATMFAPEAAARFQALMARYRETIAASFAGHVHMDGFRLIAAGDKPFGFVVMNPALSPIYGQNPSFKRIAFGVGGGIDDQSVYYLANLADAAAGAAPQWRLEMDFDAMWQVKRVDLASLQSIDRRMGASENDRDRFFASYAVLGAPALAAITPANAAVYRCAAGYDRAEDAARCACAGDR